MECQAWGGHGPAPIFTAVPQCPPAGLWSHLQRVCWAMWAQGAAIISEHYRNCSDKAARTKMIANSEPFGRKKTKARSRFGTSREHHIATSSYPSLFGLPKSKIQNDSEPFGLKQTKARSKFATYRDTPYCNLFSSTPFWFAFCLICENISQCAALHMCSMPKLSLNLSRHPLALLLVCSQ